MRSSAAVSAGIRNASFLSSCFRGPNSEILQMLFLLLRHWKSLKPHEEAGHRALLVVEEFQFARMGFVRSDSAEVTIHSCWMVYGDQSQR